MHGESRGGGTTVETNFIGYVYHCLNLRTFFPMPATSWIPPLTLKTLQTEYLKNLWQLKSYDPALR